ncbi:exosortase/archaeosortase family protein [Desulfococcus sp.]|uniref:exosortase/archaeosortase family protein n=1 Tax=Desulfococcus sp. TaxID=2025834 RepID=UPI003592F696
MKKHLVPFLAAVAIGIAIFALPLLTLAEMSRHSELYSHMLFIPIISLYLFVMDRKTLFETAEYAVIPGLAVMVAGLASYGCALFFREPLGTNDYLSAAMAGFLLWVIGSYICFWGSEAFKKAMFPLFFLAFMVPVPTVLMEWVISFLQHRSADAVQLVFDAIRFPYLREGVTFEVQGGFAISVAKECSGIRSSLALLITVVLAGKMFLRSGWRRLVLALCIIPLTIFKNALRITSLTLLASKVDMSWLTNSWLHKSGGIVYFSIALCILIPILWGLRKTEPSSMTVP